MQHKVRQFVTEILAILFAGEVSIVDAPVRNRIDDAVHQVSHAAFAFRRARLAMEILAGDNIRGGLRPVHRHFNVALFKYNFAFAIAYGRVTRLPQHFVIGRAPRFRRRREMTVELDSCPGGRG